MGCHCCKTETDVYIEQNEINDEKVGIVAKYRKQHENLLHIELMEWMESKDKQYGNDYIIIDVRTADFIGGNIKNAINIRHDEFVENIPRVINDYYKTKNIIFHCMYSMKRGPDSLEWYCSALNALLNNDQDLIDRLINHEHEDFEALHRMTLTNEQLKHVNAQNIYLLYQGFKGFLVKATTNSHLIEDFDPQYWTEDMQHIAEVL